MENGKTKKLLIIDHSVIAQKVFRNLFKAEYEGETNDELNEFTRSYIAEIEYLKAVHQPVGMLWVGDCPRADVWRHQIVRNYYGPRLNVWVDATTTGERWYSECNGKYRKVFTDVDGSYLSAHLSKKDFTTWTEEHKETYGEPVKVADRATLRAMLPQVAPMYKGNREGQHWPQSAVMSKDDFRDMSLAVARKIAPFYNGKVVRADNMEADDLAYLAVCKYQDFEIVAATTDRDWVLYALHHENYKVWDCNGREFLKTDRISATYKLWMKLLSGDKSDNIKAVRKLGKTSTIGEKSAPKIFAEQGRNLPKWARENVDPDSLQRNRVLIAPQLLPDELKERGRKVLDEARRPQTDLKSLEDIVSRTTLKIAKADGERARLMMRMQLKRQQETEK